MRNSNNIDQYRDYSRYSKYSGDKSNLSIGAQRYSRNKSSQVGHHYSSHSQKHSNHNYNTYAPDDIKYKAAQYSRNSDRKYSHARLKQQKKGHKRKNIFKCVICVVILFILSIAGYKLFPIKVTINNQELTLTYNKTLEEAINQSKITTNPGNLIAVDFSLLKKGEGKETTIKINDNEVTDTSLQLNNGDNIYYGDGGDIMEDYISDDTDIKSKSSITGVGALHKFNGTGENGIWSEMTGKISNRYAERMTKEPDNVTCTNYNPDPGNDKVIALTFDDGPSQDYTDELLSLLNKYNAKATFFVIGENVEQSWGKKLVAKESSNGHQVCTHTYDHGRSAGGTDITGMSSEKQIEEVTKGQAVIAKATGENASTVCRLPGGNINENTIKLIAKYVTAEIGWTLDTGDWQMPSSSKILKNLEQSGSGEIILCHDGGGDRSHTLEALKEFIPEYIDKGYRFITIDEMLEYPQAPQQNADSNKSNSYTSNSYSSSDYSNSMSNTQNY